MKTKSIKIDVDPKIPRHKLSSLIPLQGALKTLIAEDEEKLKKSILENGFFVPMFIWADKRKSKIMDGHQRIRVLEKMQEDGYEIPPLPAVVIKAKDETEAKKKLLLISSQFGKIDKPGLHDFLKGLDEKWVLSDFSLPNLDALKFIDVFYPAQGESIEPLEPLPNLPTDLRAVGGNGVKMIQLFFNEEQHTEVIQLIAALQDKYKTTNATDTVLKALRDARKKN